MRTYVVPELTRIGSLHELTLQVPSGPPQNSGKDLSFSDGQSGQGFGIGNAS